MARKKDKIIKMVLIVALITISAAVVAVMKIINTSYEEQHSFYQYFAGIKYTYEGSLKITKQGETTKLICKDKQIELDSTPVYYDDIDNKVIFAEDMAIVLPVQNGLMYRVNGFSKIFKDYNDIYIEFENKKKTIEDAFLYDGNNLYFFIDYTTIYVEGKEYEISPLSYAIVTYKESVEIYNKAKDEYIIIETKDANVTAKTSEYTIKLSINALKSGETEQLLIRKIDVLNPYII